MLKHKILKVALGVLVFTLSGFVSLAFPESSSAQTPKNVIIMMTDDQNVDSLPVMRKLMSFPEGSWVNFTNAIANDSICCPARASVLTGQYAFVTGVINNSSGDQVLLKNVVYRLRKKMEADPSHHLLLQTGPGVYSFQG